MTKYYRSNSVMLSVLISLVCHASYFSWVYFVLGCSFVDGRYLCLCRCKWAPASPRLCIESLGIFRELPGGAYPECTHIRHNEDPIPITRPMYFDCGANLWRRYWSD